MPWCPLCKEEYVENMKTCAECGSPLVDELPPVEKSLPSDPELPDFQPEIQEELLFTSESEIEFVMVTEALENESIAFRVDDTYPWTYQGIFEFNKYLGQNVFVRADDYIKAKEIYDYFQALKIQEPDDSLD